MIVVLLLVALWLVVFVFAVALCRAAGRSLPSPPPRDAENGPVGSREGL